MPVRDHMWGSELICRSRRHCRVFFLVFTPNPPVFKVLCKRGRVCANRPMAVSGAGWEHGGGCGHVQEGGEGGQCLPAPLRECRRPSRHSLSNIVSSLWNSQCCEESWDMKKLSMNLENVTYKIMFPKIRKKCFSLKSYPNIANINNKNYKK